MSRLTQYAYDLNGNIVERTVANGLLEARARRAQPGEHARQRGQRQRQPGVVCLQL